MRRVVDLADFVRWNRHGVVRRELMSTHSIRDSRSLVSTTSTRFPVASHTGAHVLRSVMTAFAILAVVVDRPRRRRLPTTI
jgi:hypothetical protein